MATDRTGAWEDQLVEERDRWMNTALEAEAEIERLQTEVAEWKMEAYRLNVVAGSAEAEVEQLREALDWIYAEPEDPAKVQARALAALGRSDS